MANVVELLEKAGCYASWGQPSVNGIDKELAQEIEEIRIAVREADVEQLTRLAKARADNACIIQVPREDNLDILCTDTRLTQKCA